MLGFYIWGAECSYKFQVPNILWILVVARSPPTCSLHSFSYALVTVSHITSFLSFHCKKLSWISLVWRSCFLHLGRKTKASRSINSEQWGCTICGIRAEITSHKMWVLVLPLIRSYWAISDESQDSHLLNGCCSKSLLLHEPYGPSQRVGLRIVDLCCLQSIHQPCPTSGHRG